MEISFNAIPVHPESHVVFTIPKMLRAYFRFDRFLRERELLSAERMELIRSWRHSGFNVYVGD